MSELWHKYFKIRICFLSRFPWGVLVYDNEWNDKNKNVKKNNKTINNTTILALMCETAIRLENQTNDENRQTGSVKAKGAPEW